MRFELGCALLAGTALLGACREDLGDGPMRPGMRYLGSAFGEEARTVVFDPDGRILELTEIAGQPQVAGEWMRRDGQLCIVEDPEFLTLCLTEVPFGQRGFALRHDGRQMEFTPLED